MPSNNAPDLGAPQSCRITANVMSVLGPQKIHAAPSIANALKTMVPPSFAEVPTSREPRRFTAMAVTVTRDARSHRKNGDAELPSWDTAREGKKKSKELTNRNRKKAS